MKASSCATVDIGRRDEGDERPEVVELQPDLAGPGPLVAAPDRAGPGTRTRAARPWCRTLAVLVEAAAGELADGLEQAVAGGVAVRSAVTRDFSASDQTSSGTS